MVIGYSVSVSERKERVRGRQTRGKGLYIHGRVGGRPNEIRATLVDHVLNHGLTMREAGQRVHQGNDIQIEKIQCYSAKE